MLGFSAQTDNRLDVIDPNSLQITTGYDGFVARHFIQGGRLFGVASGVPVVLDLDSGQVQPVDVQVPTRKGTGAWVSTSARMGSPSPSPRMAPHLM